MGTMKKHETHLLVERDAHKKLKELAKHEGRVMKKFFALLVNKEYKRVFGDSKVYHEKRYIYGYGK